MKRRVSIFLTAALLTISAVAVLAPTAATAKSQGPAISPETRALLKYLRTHGYLPLRGADTLAAAKARAARVVAAQHGTQVAAAGGAAPVIGTSWSGLEDSTVTPPDANGAIGPNSYLEIINLKIGIYTRSGGLTTSATLGALTGHSQFCLSDPMALWDPASQRFYYNVWDVCAATMAWGFSKDTNPTSIPGSFCNYTASFGYNPSSDIPDYPKLGQTKDFLLIGVNHYPSFSSLHADRTDLLWINKYEDPSPVTTCPASSTFGDGIFKDLRNGDNTIGFTPVPAIQTDTSSFGFVITESDIECPDICGTGMKVSVHGLKPDPTNPLVPKFLTKGHDITVGAFSSPPDAPQMGSSNLLDTLDGRMTHAVSGIDPTHGSKTAVWVSHAVAGGAGAQVNWYEINPLPIKTPSLFQSGTVSDSSLYVFDSGISNDRACDGTTCAHGDSMVLSLTTSGSSAFAATQVVAKEGTGAQSALTMVHASTTFDHDFSCAPTCRWGDYGGATPDPTKTGGTHGEVWITNEYTTGSISPNTWNAEISLT